MAGILPFGAMFIELFFIFTVCYNLIKIENEVIYIIAVYWLTLIIIVLQAIWENQFYYLFGFLFLVFVILIISCSQISIVMVYFQLCGEVSLIGVQGGGRRCGFGLYWYIFVVA